jgi:hypothetical protein
MAACATGEFLPVVANRGKNWSDLPTKICCKWGWPAGGAETMLLHYVDAHYVNVNICVCY